MKKLEFSDLGEWRKAALLEGARTARISKSKNNAYWRAVRECQVVGFFNTQFSHGELTTRS